MWPWKKKVPLGSEQDAEKVDELRDNARQIISSLIGTRAYGSLGINDIQAVARDYLRVRDELDELRKGEEADDREVG